MGVVVGVSGKVLGNRHQSLTLEPFDGGTGKFLHGSKTPKAAAVQKGAVVLAFRLGHRGKIHLEAQQAHLGSLGGVQGLGLAGGEGLGHLPGRGQGGGYGTEAVHHAALLVHRQQWRNQAPLLAPALDGGGEFRHLGWCFGDVV